MCWLDGSDGVVRQQEYVKGGNCEGDTMTRPLLLSEIFQKGKLIGYEHITD